MDLHIGVVYVMGSLAVGAKWASAPHVGKHGNQKSSKCQARDSFIRLVQEDGCREYHPLPSLRSATEDLCDYSSDYTVPELAYGSNDFDKEIEEAN
jgi:hypothetical protein